MTSRKLSIAVLFLLLAASVTSAYTVVMRDGRRVEIPNDFTVTNSTLTYEVDSGIQITIQLASVDMAATDQVNGQPLGSLMRRASSPPKTIPGQQTRRQAAERSITNADLEPYRRTRIQSELAYEKRRKELGLPSTADRQLEVAAIEDRTRQHLLNIRSQEQDAEQYWRDRATALRTELAANLAQIDFVRTRLSELPEMNSFGSLFPTVSFPAVGFPFQNPFIANAYPPSLLNSPFINHPGRLYRDRRRRFNPLLGGNLLLMPLQSFDFNEERAELLNQLNELQMRRAGLNARWRELDEEARRAGAYPGWLRP